MREADVKLCAFDFDGTIIDNVDVSHKCFVVVQQHFGCKPCTLREYQEHYNPHDPAAFLRGVGFPQDVLSHSNLVEMQKVFHRAYVLLEDRINLRDGAKGMLTAVTQDGTRCVILSNGLEGSIKRQCAKLNVLSFFHALLAREDIDTHWQDVPKKTFLDQYMTRYGIRAGNLIVVGDTPEESLFAHEMGATGVALTGGFSTSERLAAANPNRIVNSLAEVPAIVRQIFANGGPA